MKKLVILVLVLVGVALFLSKKTEKPHEDVRKGASEESEEAVCESAREEVSVEAWKSYLERYPQGQCAEEAKKFLDRKELTACKYAKENNEIYYWSDYLENFPNGKCAEEAKIFLEKEDSLACEKAKKNEEDEDKMSWEDYVEQFPEGKCMDSADKNICEKKRKENTRAGWEFYLRYFPKGKCAAEAKSVRNKFKKINGLEWSDREEFLDEDLIGEMRSYCEDLEEDGHTDWRMPTIDELRTLVQNHPGTVAGGKCRFSERGSSFYRDESCNCAEGENFSKLGDDVFLFSFDYNYSNYSDYYDPLYINFECGELSRFDLYSYYKWGPNGSLYVRCVRQDDNDACETARKYDNLYYWSFYLENFPKGKCAEEAKAMWDKEDSLACAEAMDIETHEDEEISLYSVKESWEHYLEISPNGKCADAAEIFLDKISCEEARKENTLASWEPYLKEFPNGRCAKEGNAVRSEFKRIGNLEWSNVIYVDYSWFSDSCENLGEDGHYDWRLPNIDELRTLIQNHPGTVSGGKCMISKRNNNINFDGYAPEYEYGEYYYGECDYKYYYEDDREYDREYDYNGNCSNIDEDDEDGRNCGNYSKLGDVDTLRSSSESDFGPFEVDFCGGGIDISYDRVFSARCVRQEESELCETARKYNAVYYWNFYLEHYPDGECAGEAETALDKLACGKAKEQNDSWYWEKYLEKYPQGKCAEEAKAAFEKLFQEEELKACKEARAKKDYWTWKSYLEEYPQGKCAEEAKKSWDELYCKQARAKEDYWTWKSYLEDIPEGKCAEEAKAAAEKLLQKMELNACEEAREYNTFWRWKSYLEEHPQGKCAEEAKDKLACENAREVNDSRYWEEYLKKYPQGQCVEEARERLEKLPQEEELKACEEAEEKEGSAETGWQAKFWYWESYLERYPQGKCVEKAKEHLENIACRMAREEEEYWYWKRYLEKYPKGKCADEAKTFLEKGQEK